MNVAIASTTQRLAVRAARHSNTQGTAAPASVETGAVVASRAISDQTTRSHRRRWPTARMSHPAWINYFFCSVASLPSSGAPVPDEPTNSLEPSGKVRSRPFARFDPSLAW